MVDVRSSVLSLVRMGRRGWRGLEDSAAPPGRALVRAAPRPLSLQHTPSANMSHIPMMVAEGIQREGGKVKPVVKQRYRHAQQGGGWDARHAVK